MRNNVTLLIVLISIIILIFMGTRGVKIGSFEILAISQVVEKNEDLNKKIEEANDVATSTYPEKIQKLEETYEEYKIKKQTYEDLTRTVAGNGNEIYETKQYDIGYLWRLIGNYATKRNLNLGIQVEKNVNKSNSYNIIFTSEGKYVDISQFITDIENDSNLYFRISDFKMTGNSETVKATFIVKNISLDPTTIS